MIVGPIGISVLALGASTPVGRDAASSAAAVRAGVSGLTQHPYMIDTAGEPMRVAMAPWLEADMPVGHRMQSLLWPAVEQSLGALDPSRGPLRTGIALALPAPRPGRPEELESQLREALEERYAGVFSAVAVLPTGHAGGFAGLHAACQKLQEGALDACVVAGVESYLDADTLEWLESTEQFHGAGALNNAWGFIPGEAAGACLVARDDVADTLAVEVVPATAALPTW